MQAYRQSKQQTSVSNVGYLLSHLIKPIASSFNILTSESRQNRQQHLHKQFSAFKNY